NNLDAPLPPSLTSSLQTLFDDVTKNAPDDLQLKSWLFNPGLAAATGPGWWMKQPWQSAGDPDDHDLADTLASYAQTTLPYTSQIYDPNVAVPYFSTDQAAAFAGGAFKVCSQSPPYDTIVGLTNGAWLGRGPTWSISAKNPPGFLAQLQAIQTNAPAPGFVPISIFADLQVCTRYCADHPYVSKAGAGVLSWAADSSCAVTK
ncbi:MAG: hypothetical protein ABUS79_25045, partial [Pseudomonadota bacterium]